MPGALKVIGSHNTTIFLPRALQFCTELDTKEKTVPDVRALIPQNLRARLKQNNFHARVEQALISAALARQASNLACAAHRWIMGAQNGWHAVENSNLSLQI